MSKRSLVHTTIHPRNQTCILDMNRRKSFDEQESVCEYKNAYVIMIDVVEFSNWCSTKTSFEIVSTMMKYNDIIVRTLSPYKGLFKVELVGDSCLIISKHESDKNEIMMFLSSLLSNLPYIERLFSKGIRIGLSKGDLVGSIVPSPNRFQVFGNVINVSKRLESNAVANGICTNIHSINKEFANIIPGKLFKVCLKGTGEQYVRHLFHKKRKSVAVFDDARVYLEIFGNELKKHYDYVDTFSNSVDFFQALRSTIYDIAYVDVFYDDKDVFMEMKQFRTFENKYREEVQLIVANSAASKESLQKECKYFDHYLFDDYQLKS